MDLVRFAIANVNATVGAVRSNVDRAIALAEKANADDASLCVFPEQMIGGYSPEDLVQWEAFVESQWTALARFAEATKAMPMACVVGVAARSRSHVYNAAAMVLGGKVWGVVPKEKLPTYNVFYEARVFAHGEPGLAGECHGVPFGDLVFDLDFGCVGVEVCEDIWSPDGPMRRRSYAGAEVIANVSSSPFRLGVEATRREMISTRAADNQVAIVYANMVGANDGLVFDGGSYFAQNGRIVKDGPRFCEGVVAMTLDMDRTRRLRVENSTWRSDEQTDRRVTDRGGAGHSSAVKHIVVTAHTRDRSKLTYPAPAHKSFFLPRPSNEENATTPRARFCEELLDAMTLGLGDYFEKTGAFKTIGVALSGGRDSLLCMLIARRYIDRRFADLDQAGRDAKAKTILRGIFMPSQYSSAETRKAAEVTAREVGAEYASVAIDDAVAHELENIKLMLAPGEAMTPLALQNIQARIRSQRMWTWANSAGALFIQTSNMSEKAVGYSTIGGDMEGALSVIANVPKTVVNYLLDYLLETTSSQAIRLTLAKPASAELAANQEDERDLMPFPVLDACFALYAEEKMVPSEVKRALGAMFFEYSEAELGAWVDKFARLFTQSIYKWVQAPLCLHMGNLDLDRERALQLPVVQRSEWQHD